LFLYFPVVILELFTFNRDTVKKIFNFVLFLLGEGLNVITDLLVKITNGTDGMLTGLSMTTTLDTMCAEVTLTFEAEQLVLLGMGGTQLQCVDGVDGL
jgi:hypothetical protein